MSDSIDKAQDTDEFFRKTALNQSLKPVPDAVFSGVCLFCDAPLIYPRRWCNSQCRDDWKKENV